MADRKRRTRRTRRKKVEEPEVEVEEVEEEEEESEEPEVKAKSSRRRRRPRRVVIKESEEVDEEEEEPFDLEELPEDEEPDDDESPVLWDDDNQPVLDGDEDEFTMGVVTEENPVLAALQSMHNGQLLTVMRVSDDTWVLSTAQAKNNKPLARHGGKLTGKEYEIEVLTPEYRQWRDEWNKLSTDEKLKEAKKAKLEWDEHDTVSINIMRVGMAMVEHLGLEKYKEEYQTRSARRKVRG